MSDSSNLRSMYKYVSMYLTFFLHFRNPVFHHHLSKWNINWLYLERVELVKRLWFVYYLINENLLRLPRYLPVKLQGLGKIKSNEFPQCFYYVCTITKFYYIFFEIPIAENSRFKFLCFLCRYQFFSVALVNLYIATSHLFFRQK